MPIKEFNNPVIKITVEERSDGMFIATRWDKEVSLEVDRIVTEFETYGGALDQAFEWLAEETEVYFKSIK